MTEDFNKIMTAYRDADFNQRLNLYLQYPRLRSGFIQIDQNDLKTDLSTGFKLRKKLQSVQINMFLSQVAGSVKKIFGIAPA
jgi:hypothetical protein